MNTLLEAVEAFTVGQAGEVSSKTRAWYASRLSAFASWVGDVPLSKVTAASAVGWVRFPPIAWATG